MKKISKKIVALATMAAFVLTLVPAAAFGAVGTALYRLYCLIQMQRLTKTLFLKQASMKVIMKPLLVLNQSVFGQRIARVV